MKDEVQSSKSKVQSLESGVVYGGAERERIPSDTVTETTSEYFERRRRMRRFRRVAGLRISRPGQ